MPAQALEVIVALAPDEALRAIEQEFRRLAVSIEDLFRATAPDSEAAGGYLEGVGFDVAIVLPLLSELPNGAGPAIVRDAIERHLIEISGSRWESTDRPA